MNPSRIDELRERALAIITQHMLGMAIAIGGLLLYLILRTVPYSAANLVGVASGALSVFVAAYSTFAVRHAYEAIREFDVAKKRRASLDAALKQHVQKYKFAARSVGEESSLSPPAIPSALLRVVTPKPWMSVVEEEYSAIYWDARTRHGSAEANFKYTVYVARSVPILVWFKSVKPEHVREFDPIVDVDNVVGIARSQRQTAS